MAAGWPEVLLLYVFLSSIYFMSKVFYMVLRSWERFGAACAVPLDPRASRAKSVESAEPCDCEPISATAFLQKQRSPVADFFLQRPTAKHSISTETVATSEGTKSNSFKFAQIVWRKLRKESSCIGVPRSSE